MTRRNAGGLRVALTFDAEHPDREHRPGISEAILDTLARRGVTSTWFLQGRWVEANPATARRVAAEGHLVGNHSFYHARLPLLTSAGLRTDVRAAETVIREVVGVDPRPWFRCPFGAGARDRRVLGVLAELGYRDVGQDVSLEDWEPRRTGPAIAADALRLVPAVDGPAVVLFHSWPPGTLDALEPVVDGLRKIGATFVRLDELEQYAA
ncbi:MAG TPA: polysaccharide deacetylase family protein [Candidatus Limnocylindrales bacterium]